MADPLVALSVSPGIDLPGLHMAAERVKGAQKENKLLDLALQAEEAEQARLMQPPDYADFVDTGLESLLAVGKTIKTMLGDEVTPEKRAAILEMVDQADKSIAGRYKGRQFPGLGEFREKVKSEDAAAIHDSIDELFDIVDMANRVKSGDPAAVREYQFFESLPDSRKEEYLRVKRATTQFATVGQVPGQFNRETNQFNPAQTPAGPATIQGEAGSAATIAGAEEAAKQGAQIDAIAPKATVTREQENIAAAPTNVARAETTIEKANNALEDIAAAVPKIGGSTTGVYGWIQGFRPGSDRKDLESLYKSIKSTFTVEALAEMKAQSRTGASGMGALSERELEVIESLVANLDANTSPELQNRSLNKLKRHLLRLKLVNDASANVNAELISPEDARVLVRKGWADIDGDMPAEDAGVNVIRYDAQGNRIQ